MQMTLLVIHRKEKNEKKLLGKLVMGRNKKG